MPAQIRRDVQIHAASRLEKACSRAAAPGRFTAGVNNVNELPLMRPYETPLHDPWCCIPVSPPAAINSTLPVVALLHRISSLCLALTTIPHVVSNSLGCFLCSCALPACACVRMSALLYVIPAVYPASVIAMLLSLPSEFHRDNLARHLKPPQSQ